MPTGIFAILDDVAMLLDDTAVMSKIAAKKTAGLLGDDLAVNAEQATGFHASRELPVIWAITKGSLLNKLMILPIALLLSSYLPWLILPILLIGGTYLSFEGVEKVYEWFAGHETKEIAAKTSANSREILTLEAAKIKAAVRTDFVLSIEIVVISLETVFHESLLVQILVVSFVALLATVGVYGFVALLVRMDDIGFYLIEHAPEKQGIGSRSMRWLGKIFVSSLPVLIRILGVVGTVAMLLVGGGLFVHNIEVIHHFVEVLPAVLAELATGLVVGTVLLLMVELFKKIKSVVT